MKNSIKYLAALALIGLGVACEDIVEIPDISNQQVALLAPRDQTVVLDSAVTFNWVEVSDAEAYIIQLATPNFENAAQILLDSTVVIDSTFVGARASRKLSNGDYQWRVKAVNSGYETQYSTSTFTVNSTN